MDEIENLRRSILEITEISNDIALLSYNSVLSQIRRAHQGQLLPILLPKSNFCQIKPKRLPIKCGKAVIN